MVDAVAACIGELEALCGEVSMVRGAKQSNETAAAAGFWIERNETSRGRRAKLDLYLDYITRNSAF